MISRNLKIRYRKSWLGMFWTLLIPAGSALIYYVVFDFILKVKIDHYLLFILSGIIPWTYVSASIVTGVESIANNHSLLNKVPLPPQALVLSDMLTYLINFLLSFPILLLIFCFSKVPWSFAMIQYPVLGGILALTVYGMCTILAIGFVYFRDIRYITQLVMQLWFYLTPVMYELKMVPREYLFLVNLNPIGLTFNGFHESIVAGNWIPFGEWSIILGWCLALNFIAILLLRKTAPKIIEML